jgi:nucleotide-binding universal stress UspA family protein
MKKILITTDFSAVSEKAVHYAFNLAGNQACEFSFLHASYSFHSDSSTNASFSFFDAFYSFAKINMQQFIAFARELDSLHIHTFKGFLFPSPLTEAVNFLSYQQNFDMIITGTKSNLEDMYASNMAAAILKDTSTNAIIVPEKANITHLQNVVMVFDGQATCPLNNLSGLKDILQKNNATLTLLNVLKHKNQDKFPLPTSIYQHFFEGVKVIDYPVFDKKLQDGIISYLKLNKTDMLVTITQQRTFFEGIFNRPVSSKLVANLSIPLMNICNKAYADETCKEKVTL